MFAPHRQKRSRLVLVAVIGSGLFWFAVSPPNLAQAQAPDPATQLYVSFIQAGWYHAGGSTKQSLAIVDIVDGNGNPVNGTLVVGNWSGCFRRDSDSDMTETVCSIPGFGPMPCVDGRAVIWGKKMSCPKKQCAFTFTITDVQKDGMTYVPVAGKTSSLITCATFAASSRRTNATWVSGRQVVTRTQQMPTRRLARWWHR